MLTRAEARMIRDSEHARRQWERSFGSASAGALAGHAPSPWTFDFGFGLFERLSGAIEQLLRGAQALRVAIPAPFVRRALAVAIGGSAATAVLASTLAVKGYLEHPGSELVARLTDRKVSPIYDADRTLIGAVSTQASFSPAEAANLTYIPLQGDVPTTFKQALLQFENKHFNDNSARVVCGIDVLSLLRPLASFGQAGGSGIPQQLTKQLMQPEWGSEGNVFSKGWRWAQQLGASCALWRAMGGDEARDSILTAYANYAPQFQGNGVLRGIQSAARVVFDVDADQLSDAQQLIFAAAVKEPLRVLPAGATRVECARVYPRKDNPSYEAETARANAERANQCRVIHRAISMANAVLQGKALEHALAELRGYQRDGIVPVNPFEPISTKKLVNLSTRTKAALPSGVLSQIRREAETTNPGEELVVSLDAIGQHEFSEKMKHALAAVQSSPAGRRSLCIPLVETDGAAPSLRHCGIDETSMRTADVLAMKTDVRTGGLRVMYATSPLIADSVQSIGSVAKWVIHVAAIADGYTASTMVCPRQASDNGRPLHRVKAPTEGYANCDGGRNAITFEQATAESDNLAFNDIAKTVGPEKLAAAARALGLGDRGAASELPYALSFGTFSTTPRELMGAAQALFATAYDVHVTGTAPRVLVNVGSKPNPATAALSHLLSTPQQHGTLRALLEAPVEFEHGTLGVFRKDVDAGKSGSTQATSVDADGRKYAHGKWAVTFHQQRGEVNLFMVAAPTSSLPLAHHAIGASVFAPAHRVLLTNSEEKLQ